MLLILGHRIFSYDILKIKDVDVWKIDKSSVNGMKKITGSNEVKASVVQGNPNIFYNIAKKEDSASGRLRYSVEPQQHDSVEWNEGPRSNNSDGLGENKFISHQCGKGHLSNFKKEPAGIIYNNTEYPDSTYLEENTDSIDKKTMEYKKFKVRRQTENTATVISDFLILQTSSGDQSIIYFDKDSEPTKTQDDFDKVVIPLDSLWESNSNSASNMEHEDINIGSYNGKFYNTRSKYNGSGNNSFVTTVFDSDPAKTIVRPIRPIMDLRLMKTGIDIVDTNKNGEYLTGRSSVFYKHILDVGETSDIYTDTFTEFGKGLLYPTSYSDSHNKINDIIIHNPVSTQCAMIIPEDDIFDQRTSKSKIIGGNLVPDTIETETKLKEIHDLQNFVYNGDAEIFDSHGNILNWVGIPISKEVTYESKSSEIISGKNSLTIVTKPNSNKTEKFQSTTIGMPNTNYHISAKLKAIGCEGYLLVEAYNGDKKLKDWSYGNTYSGSIVSVSDSFISPDNTDVIKVSVVNGDSHSPSGSNELVSADDIQLTIVGSESDSFKTIPYTEYINSSVDNPIYVKPYTISNLFYEPEKQILNPEYVAPHKGDTKVFNYSGSYKTYTAPVTGKYTLNVWGAQGGNGAGGLGGHSSGEINLTAGERLYIYTGGSNGFNGGGSGHSRSNQCGGGASDIRKNGNSLYDRIIVAGGGGGRGDRESDSDGYGGAGGGMTGGNGGKHYGSKGYGGSQSSGGAGGDTGGRSGSFGVGGSNTTDSGSGGGGGGGGYYGGGAGGNDSPRHHDNDDSGGGGGSGYIGGVSNGSMDSGVRSGDGLIEITEPDVKGNNKPKFLTIPEKGDKTITINNSKYVKAYKNSKGDLIPAKGTPFIKNLSPTIESSTVIESNVSTPPKSWYEIVETKKPANPTIEIPGLGDKTAGDMVVLGRDFDIYFPNKGDFYDNGSYGISNTTVHRGKGFTNRMDTTEWTKKKQVSFNFDVIYNDKMYTVGEYIDLKVDQSIYNFKVPICDSEAISAEVNFRVLANNGSFFDYKSDTNKKRKPNCSAYHSAIKKYNIDVVGRIGNLVMEDTTDYRFSNYFKNSMNPTSWFIDNVVKDVDIESQNNYLGANVNIFGNPIDSDHYLNTFGSLDFLQKRPKNYPLTPSNNNIEALKKQPTRLGYYMLMDIETVGNYYNNMQIIPYYYSLNLSTGDISPVDVYANIQGTYKPINIFNNVVPGWNTNSIYKNYVELDWLDNSARRNYHEEEKAITEYVKSRMSKVTEEGEVIPIDIPRDNDYKYGVTQILQLKERNRTFIGTTTEDGEDFNPGDTIPEFYYNKQAQRWHFSIGVPSSAVFVEAGKDLTKPNMDKIMNNKTVILAALDIKASGDTYVLEYEHPEGNNTLNIAGKDYDISTIDNNVIGVYSSEKSSAEDLSISGTH